MEFIFTKTPLAFFIQDLWRDEAFSYLLAKKDIFSIAYLSLLDFSPPLYTYVLKFWMMFFGSSEIALRSLSLLFFVLLLFTACHFLLDVFKLSHRISILGMLLFLINPILLYYAFEARPYSMFACLATVSFYAFLTKKKRLYYLSTIAGLYTHYFMIFVIIIQIMYMKLHKKKDFNERMQWVYRSFFAFLPWLLFAVGQKVVSSSSFWIEKVKFKDLLYLPAVIYSGYEKNFGFPSLNRDGYPQMLLWLSLVLFALAGVTYLKVRYSKKNSEQSLFLLLALWAGLPTIAVFVLSFFKPLYLPRYLIFCAPAFVFLFIHCLKYIKNPLKILLLILVVVLTFKYDNLQIKYRKKSHVSSVFKEIKALAGPNDLIYTPNELDYFTAQYYAGPEKVYIYAKEYTEIPSYVGKALIPKERIRTTLPNYPAKAFIFKDDNYDIQTLN